MNKILLSLLASVIIIASCNSTTEKKDSVNPEQQLADESVVDSALIQTPAEVATVTTAPNTINTQPNPNASATGMNPAHGEPGHRCDIAVGAPLNSPPGNTQAANTPTIMTAPAAGSPPQDQGPAISNLPPTTPVNVNPAGSQTATAPGMNPPHGQPGHDCSIAVGSPLKK